MLYKKKKILSFFGIKFSFKRQGCISPSVIIPAPTEGTLTPNKILLLHFLREDFERTCTHQARND